MHRTKVFVVFFAFISLIVFSINFKNLKNKKRENNTEGNLTEQSFFKQIIFFNIQSVNLLKIKANELLIQNNGKELLFIKPDGLLKNSGSLFFNSDTGSYNKIDNFIHLLGNAKARMKHSRVLAKKINFKVSDNFLEAKENVKFRSKKENLGGTLHLTSDYLRSFIDSEKIFLKGKVHGYLKRFRNYQKGLQFFSNTFDFNGGNGIGHLKENVKLNRENWNASAQNGMIYLNNHSKRLKYYQLNDDVKLVENVNFSTSDSFVRKAFSERLVGYILEQKTLLLGEPKIYQKGDLIRGTKITLYDDKALIEVDNSNSNFQMKK